jgi:putative membrane protein
MPDGTKDALNRQAESITRTAENVTRQADDVLSSAAQVERTATATKQLADRTTQLAADRTVLAAERTYAAWVRTGLASLASGVGARTLLAGVLPGWFGILTGSGLVLFSGFCFVAAVWREISTTVAPPLADIQRLPTPLLLVINGFLVLIDIAALIGVWVARI